MFAIITPALITGALFANRVTQGLHALPHGLADPGGTSLLPHDLASGRHSSNGRVLDFAGGIVVHNTAGLAALASILYIGKRRIVENTAHNIPLIALAPACYGSAGTASTPAQNSA